MRILGQGPKSNFLHRLHPNAKRYMSNLKQCYVIKENEKKHYNQRIIGVDQEGFTPKVFAVNRIVVCQVNGKRFIQH